MKTINVLLTMLLLVAFSIASYASGHDVKTVKAHPIELVIFTVHNDNGIVFKNDAPNRFGIVYSEYFEMKRPAHYIPLSLGKVINKPLTNNRYKGCEHWYCSHVKVC